MIRTFLATVVVLGHSYGEVFIGSALAVQLFYMISGFLMSYILVEKQSYATVAAFYISRYLRLFPVYAVVASLTLIALSIASLFDPDIAFFQVYRDAPWPARALLAAANATMVCQDWIMFLGVGDGQLALFANYQLSEVPLWAGLLVPPAWTLGVELSFYLVAPFILPRKVLLLSLLLCSVGIRAWLLVIGIGTQDPWSYRFFPCELATFLAGALSHQLILPFVRRSIPAPRWSKAGGVATFVIVAVLAGYSHVPVPEPARALGMAALFLLLLPLCFIYQSTNEQDRWIGELSYPLYICHWLVLEVLRVLLRRFGTQDPALLAGSVLISAFTMAWILNVFVARPSELLRTAFRRPPDTSLLRG